MLIKRIMVLVFFSSMLTVAACSKDLAPGDYDASEVGKIKRVAPGVIVSMRPVRLHAREESQATEGTNSGEISRSHGYEYVVKLNSGNIISVVQADNIKLKTRQHILVIYGTTTRVVPDNGSEDF